MKPHLFTNELSNIRWHSSFIVYCLLFIGHCQAQTLSPAARVSLITAGTGPDITASFGYTVLRIRDSLQGIDRPFLYALPAVGPIDFSVQILRGNVQGQLTIIDLPAKLLRWQTERRMITERGLRLSAGQKQRLADALTDNYRPRNRQFQYRFFDNNGSTRVRDMLVRICGDSLVFPPEDSLTYPFSFRDEVNGKLVVQQWTEFGLNLLLGYPADTKVTIRSSLFMPQNLQYRLHQSTIRQPDGRQLPFLTDRLFSSFDQHPVYDSTLVMTLKIFFFSPTSIMYLALGPFWWSRKRNWTLPLWFDAGLFSLTGLAGWLLVWLWVGSEQGMAAWNPSLIVFNPLYFPLIFLATHPSQQRFGRVFFMTVQVLFLIQILIVPMISLANHVHTNIYDLFGILLIISARANANLKRLNPPKTQPTTA